MAKEGLDVISVDDPAYQGMVVEQVRRENSAITSLVLRGNLSEAFRRRHAGQFLMLQLPEAAGWSGPHPYTISNAPEDAHLQITAKALGPFSIRLQSTAVGTNVCVAGPYGRFCRTIEQCPASIMIAGGIGITPFLSVLRHFRQAQIRRQAVLFWANNTIHDFFALPELKQIVAEGFGKVVLVCLESPDKVSSDMEPLVVESGYLTQKVLERHSGLRHSAVYLCGSEAMQVYVMHQLDVAGIPVSAVKTERFGVFSYLVTDRGAIS